MVQQQYYDVRTSMLTTFITIVVAVMVAVPVAAYMAMTLAKTQLASASTYSQNAQVSPAPSYVAAGSASACVSPSEAAAHDEEVAAGASASMQSADVWSHGGSKGSAGFMSAIYQYQNETHNTTNNTTTTYKNSFNEGSFNTKKAKLNVAVGIDNSTNNSNNNNNSNNTTNSNNPVTSTTVTTTTVSNNNVNSNNDVMSNNDILSNNDVMSNNEDNDTQVLVGALQAAIQD